MEFKNKNKLAEQRDPKPLRNRKTAKETTEKKKDRITRKKSKFLM